eukprot:290930_1
MSTKGSYELPSTAVAKIISKSNPNIKVKKDAKSAISKAAGIFVLYLAHNANELCKQSNRATIQADDVLTALNEIEFAEFDDELRRILTTYRREQEQIKANKKQKKEAKAKEAQLNANNNNNNINNNGNG